MAQAGPAEYEIEPREVTAVVHTMSLMLSIFSNICFVVIICRAPTLHTPTCILMVALALVDIMLSVVWNVTPIALLDNGLREMLPDTWMCNGIGLFWQVMVTMSALLQGIIAFDRYFFIVHPLKYQVHVTNKRAVICCVVVLLFATSLPAAILISGSTYSFNAPAMTCSGSTLWSVWFLVVLFSSVTIATVSYQRVWKLCCLALRQKRHRNANVKHLLPSVELTAQKTRSASGVCASSSSLSTGVLGLSRRDTVTTKEYVSTVIKKNTTTITTTVSETLSISTNKCDCKDDTSTPYPAQHSPVSIVVVKKREDSFENTCTKSTTHQEQVTTIRGHDNILPKLSKETKSSPEVTFNKEPTKSTLTFINRNSIKITQTPKRDSRKINHDPKFLIKALEEMCVAAKTPVTTPGMTRKHNKNVGIAALQWTAICNPVISWMLSVQEQTGDISQQGSKINLRHAEMATMNQSSKFFSPSKLRRIKAWLLVGLPVLCVALSFLPLLASLIYWDHGRQTSSDFLAIRIVCHVSYSVIPSATSLLLYLTNKPYRSVLRNQMCCAHKRLGAENRLF